MQTSQPLPKDVAGAWRNRSSLILPLLRPLIAGATQPIAQNTNTLTRVFRGSSATKPITGGSEPA